MYPLPSTPLPSVSGFVPRPSPTFKPIPPKGQPSVTSPRPSDQPQKDDSVGTSPGSSLPCGQGMPQDPPSSTNESPSWSPQHSPQQVLPQPNPPPITPSSGSQINPSAKPFIPAAMAPQNVPSSPQQNIPKSTNGEGVKCSRQQGKSQGQGEQLCFRCKQPGHLKRDCPELPYCSKCRTKGHVPARCPTKQQDAEQAPEGREFHGPTHEGNELSRNKWRRSQDQLRFSNPNRCLSCAGNHSTHDCPARHQHRVSTTSNPTSGSGIYNNKSNPNISSPPNSSPPQNSQQSQSTVGITTPTLMVINPPRQPGPTTGPNQPLQYPTQHFNPHFLQPPSSQVSPLLHPGQPFNPQVPPPYFPQYAPSNSPSVGSEASYLAVIHKQLERQEKQDRESNEIERLKEEQKKMKEEHEQWKEACKKEEKKEIQHCNRVNKSFEKIPRFDGTNPVYCFDCLMQIEALVNDNEGRNYREELLFNCGISVTKMIQAVP